MKDHCSGFICVLVAGILHVYSTKGIELLQFDLEHASPVSAIAFDSSDGAYPMQLGARPLYDALAALD